MFKSTILSVYEREVEETIEQTKIIPSEIAYMGSISLSRNEICKNIGIIFVKRSSVNLHSDLLDPPEIFYDYEEKYALNYKKIRKYLDIDKRLEVLNKRLDILRELYDMLNNEVKNMTQYYLELATIILIVLAVFTEIIYKVILKDILKII